ncbi:MAG: CopG family transcriptional regulator [Solirubrobacterales bacterium]
MAARRTQIYLDDDLRARIERVRARDGRSMAEIIRVALDRYLGEDERVRRPLTEGPAPPWLGAWSGEGSPLPELREERARRAQRSAR